MIDCETRQNDAVHVRCLHSFGLRFGTARKCAMMEGRGEGRENGWVIWRYRVEAETTWWKENKVKINVNSCNKTQREWRNHLHHQHINTVEKTVIKM